MDYQGDDESVRGVGIMSHIPPHKVLNLIELIYRVQEVYYHDWDVSTEGGMNKKDVQIVQ